MRSTGRWGKASHATRARLLFKLADLIESRAEEIALLETLDNGKPFRNALEVDVASAVEDLRYFAGWATKITGESQRGPGTATSTPTRCASRSAWSA